MNPETQSTPSARQATAREFFAVVFRRKWIILGLFFVTTATVVAIALSTPRVYMSTGRVLLKRGEPQSVLNPTRNQASWEEDLASEVEVVRSTQVAERAQQMLDEQAPRGGARIRLEPREIDVQVVGQSNVMVIGYTDPEPRLAERGCDAVIKAYVEHRQRTLNLSYPKQFFDRSIDSVRRELTRLEIERRDFATHSGISDLEDQRRSIITRLTTLQANRSDVATELAGARAALRAARGSNADAPLDYSNDAGLIELKRQVIAQQARVAQLRERYRDDAPEVVGAMSTLDDLRALLRRENDQHLAMLQSRVQVIESRLASMDQDIGRIRGELNMMPANELRLGELNRQINVLKKTYEELAFTADRAQMNQETMPRITIMVLSPAGRATPRNARDYIRLGLAPAFSLVVGVGIAFFMDGLDIRLRTASEVEHALDLPVLTAITEQRRRRSAPARRGVGS